METNDDVTLGGMFRTSPIRSGVFTVGPVLVALAQLLNSYFHELPWLASVPFAVVMVAYSVLFTQYHLAQLRRRDLERSAVAPAAD